MTVALEMKQNLSAVNIPAELIRIPKELGLGTCGYALELPHQHLHDALRHLSQIHRETYRVFVSFDGKEFVPYQEGRR